MMADFQNALISRTFGFFGLVSCTEQLSMVCRMAFDLFFGILIFEPKSGFCMGSSLYMHWRFLKCSHFSNIWCLLEKFFGKNNYK